MHCVLCGEFEDISVSLKWDVFRRYEQTIKRDAKGVNDVSSTDLVKKGNRPEMLFRVTLSPDGTTYQKEISLVFPRYASADLPHYKDEYMPEARDKISDECQWHFNIED